MTTWQLLLDEEALLKRINPVQRIDSVDPYIRKKERKRNHDYKSIIDQHSIIYSDCLSEIIYSKYGELYMSRFQEFINCECDIYNSIKIEDTESKKISDWFQRVIEQESSDEWFIIYQDPESISNIENTETKCYYIDDVIKPVLNNQIRRNSPDCKIRIKNNINCDICAQWFKELLHGEKKVEIFDLYIIQDSGISVLEKYIAPYFEDGATIIIYTDWEYFDKYFDLMGSKNKTIRKRIQTIADKHNLRIEIQTAKRKKSEKINSQTVTTPAQEHDRHIFLTSNIHITIGKGLDFLNPYTGKTEGTEIGIYDDEETSANSIKKEYTIENGIDESTYKRSFIYSCKKRK